MFVFCSWAAFHYLQRAHFNNFHFKTPFYDFLIHINYNLRQLLLFFCFFVIKSPSYRSLVFHLHQTMNKNSLEISTKSIRWDNSCSMSLSVVSYVWDGKLHHNSNARFTAIFSCFAHDDDDNAKIKYEAVSLLLSSTVSVFYLVSVCRWKKKCLKFFWQWSDR